MVRSLPTRPNPKVVLDGKPFPEQTAQADLQQAWTNLQSPNIGPFSGKQLIQFLVTSKPDPLPRGVSPRLQQRWLGRALNMAA